MSKSQLRLNLEQQKTRAKELRDAVREGEQDAVERVLRNHPKADNVGIADAAACFGKLSDAQLVIARELGLPSWPKLKAHIESLDRTRRAIASKAPPPDAEPATLHIRCGSDICDPLKQAGFVGDFLEVSDPLCLGPVPRGGDWVDVRVRFLGEFFDFKADPAMVAKVEADYRRTEERLASARERYRRVVLWFEHDSYDQIILSRVLAAFAAQRAQTPVELICIDRFPAITRFVGLGQLTPEALRLLWESRAPVSSKLIRLGVAVWDALREPSPSALHAIAAGGTPDLPVMAVALRRHLQELPWTRDGLSLTQRLVLQGLRRGPQSGSALHRAFWTELEPLPFLGDAMLWGTLRDMQRVTNPPFDIDAAKRWEDRVLSLNATGEALLAGELDWLTLHPPERWVGGVRVVPAERVWRWSGEKPVH